MKAKPKKIEAGESLRGVSCVLGEWVNPQGDGPFKGCRAQYAAGSFDRFFRELRAGNVRVALLFNHKDDIELASTDDGALRVWEDEGEINFSLHSARARNAFRVLAGMGNRFKVSQGTRPIRWLQSESDSSFLIVTEARLFEISLLIDQEPASTRTWARIS